MNHKVLSHKDSFDIIFNKLKERKPFSFVRFGDGDHVLMYKDSVGATVGGGNRFLVTEKLRSEIIECYNIEDENFLVGTMLNDFSEHQMSKTNRIIDHSRLPKKLIERKEMLAMSCLFEIFLTDINKFSEFAHEMRKTSTMFIGNYSHKNIEKIYGKGIYIKVFPTNCYINIDNWYQKILDDIDKVDKIVLSAGFAGRVVAKRLFKAGIKKMVLDVGSLSDAFILHTDRRLTTNIRTFMKQVESKVYTNAGILIIGKAFKGALPNFIVKKKPVKRNTAKVNRQKRK